MRNWECLIKLSGHMTGFKNEKINQLLNFDMKPICLTIAGADPTSGAGIQADIRTMDRIGVHPFSVITALTYQSATKFFGFKSLSDDLERQLNSILNVYPIKYVKIGMIPDSKALEIIINYIKKFSLTIVYDPVTISSAGKRLSSEGLEGEIEAKLLPLVNVFTPNFNEALFYANKKIDEIKRDSKDSLKEVALIILKKMENKDKAVVIKSAGINKDEIYDIISISKKKDVGSEEIFKTSSKKRMDVSGNVHGTGCVFSSAIAAFLIKGLDIEASITQAEDFFNDKFAKFVELPEQGKTIDLTIPQEEEYIINEIKRIYNYISDIKDFTKLIPEVRLNISYSFPAAEDKEDIAAIEGRITVINGYPRASGEIKFGVSDHTARLILTAKEYDKTINCVMNLRYKEDYIKKIQEDTELKTYEFIRDTQPAQIKSKEHSTMQWLIGECVKNTGQVPDIVWDKGSIGKEPIIRVFGKDSKDMIEKLKKIIYSVF